MDSSRMEGENWICQRTDSNHCFLCRHAETSGDLPLTANAAQLPRGRTHIRIEAVDDQMNGAASYPLHSQQLNIVADFLYGDVRAEEEVSLDVIYRELRALTPGAI